MSFQYPVMLVVAVVVGVGLVGGVPLAAAPADAARSRPRG